MNGDAKKTLVFCTAYAGGLGKLGGAWDGRYRRWLDAVLASGLHCDQFLMVDDGSPTLPEWPDVAKLSTLPSKQPEQRAVIFHFGENLGRHGVYDYPGWFRSFTFVSQYAQTYGFEKIIHIESDAFLISRRIVHFMNAVTNEWLAFFCPRHGFPETGIQVMAGRGLNLYHEFAKRPYGEFIGHEIERMIPFTHVERGFVGNRFAEYLNYVPAEADWTMQGSYQPKGYYWWMVKHETEAKMQDYVKKIDSNFVHDGIGYLEFFGHLSGELRCKSYFEIGTHTGNSLKRFRCDSVSVDPNFKISQDVLEKRRRAHFFQMTSDDFFDHYNLGVYLPGGPDVSFLDGLHVFEVLLRDFISTEKYAHDNSVILLHDCLPLNSRMAERKFRVDQTEDARTRDMWTGDVWRLLPILKKYRPDLRILQFDCGPTGLVACSRLDPYSRVLSDNYTKIVEEFNQISLTDLGIASLWRTFPTIDSKRLVQNITDLPSVLFG